MICIIIISEPPGQGFSFKFIAIITHLGLEKLRLRLLRHSLSPFTILFLNFFGSFIFFTPYISANRLINSRLNSSISGERIWSTQGLTSMLLYVTPLSLWSAVKTPSYILQKLVSNFTTCCSLSVISATVKYSSWSTTVPNCAVDTLPNAKSSLQAIRAFLMFDFFFFCFRTTSKSTVPAGTDLYFRTFYFTTMRPLSILSLAISLPTLIRF